MLSTGDMPDLITFDATNSSTMEDLVKQKALYSMDEIAQK